MRQQLQPFSAGVPTQQQHKHTRAHAFVEICQCADRADHRVNFSLIITKVPLCLYFFAAKGLRNSDLLNSQHSLPHTHTRPACACYMGGLYPAPPSAAGGG